MTATQSTTETTSGEHTKYTEGSHWSGTAKRNLGSKTKMLATVFAVIIGVYHIYTAYTGIPPAFINRPIHLTFLGGLIFMWYSPWLQTNRKTVPWYDWISIFLLAFCSLYFGYQMNYGGLAGRAGQPVFFDIVVSVIGLLLILELARRMTGLILPIVTIGTIIYALFGPYMPALVAHQGFSLSRTSVNLFLTTNGVFGLPLGVSATYVILFIIFGALMEVTGIGDWFIDIAYGLTGRLTGGPAKTSVLASGFMGSLNGSAVANAATTGAFTIPLMKRTGFEDKYAAAVESAASCGGQVLPPVMAASAFIMVAWTGIPYRTIIAAATIPALLYFLAIGFAIHFNAKKQGLAGVPKDELPNPGDLFSKKFQYIIPISTVVYFLAAGFTPIFAAFYGIVLTGIVAIPKQKVVLLVQSIVQRDLQTIISLSKNSVQVLTDALEKGVQMTLVVTAACATAGVIVGVVSLTGIGLRFAGVVASISGGTLFIALVLTMITSIILGMGLPTTAAYIVLASLGAPALTELGVNLLAAHMFILYFGVVSGITPPIMLAVFAASGIAESDPWQTAIEAIQLAAVGFIVPFLFVYGPELLLEGTIFETITATATGIIGVILLSAGTQGYFFTELTFPLRLLASVNALIIMIPTPMTDLIGTAVLGIILGQQFLSMRTNQPSGTPAD